MAKRRGRAHRHRVLNGVTGPEIPMKRSGRGGRTGPVRKARHGRR